MSGSLPVNRGDIIVVPIKEAIPRGRVKKGDVMKAVVVRTAKDIRRPDGTVIRFDSNAAVLQPVRMAAGSSSVLVIVKLLDGKGHCESLSWRQGATTR